jgi:hypothetical protein
VLVVVVVDGVGLDRDSADVGNVGSVGLPALVSGLPGTVDWQPTRSAPVATTLATFHRTSIDDRLRTV